MNRFSILIALVAFVGAASAFQSKGGVKHHGLRHHQHPQHFQSEGEEFGEEFGGSSRFQNFDDEEQFGLGHGHNLRNNFDHEGFNRNGGLSRHGHGHGLGHRHGGHSSDIGLGFPHGHGEGFGNSHRHGGKLSHHGKRQGSGLGRRSGVQNGSGINRHGSGGFEQGSIGGGNRFGGHGRRQGSSGFGGHGAGIIGGNRKHHGVEAGLGGSNHAESNLGLEGHQGANIQGEGHFNTAHNRGQNDDLEGVRKHQVINKEKTTVKDKTNGVNDVDAFRHSTGNHDDRHTEIGASGSASENLGASLNSHKELDNEFGAGLAGESTNESAGAAGIGSAGAGSN